MSEVETTEWQEMLRHINEDQITDSTTIDNDGVKHVDVEIKLVHDDRRAKWQRLLLDAVDEDAVLHAVWEFLYKRLEDKVRRHEEGESWRDDRKYVLMFPHESEELRAAAERATAFGMSEVVAKLLKRIEKEHKLTEGGWYDFIGRDQMQLVIYEIVLSNYFVPNSDL